MNFMDDLRKFDPLLDNHFLVSNGWLCTYCELPFEAGDVTTLVPMWLTDDPNIMEAQPAHWDCALKEQVKGEVR